MNDNTWLALRQKLLLIEADRHRIGWHASTPLVHAITADASRLRYQLLTRPASVSASANRPTNRSTPTSHRQGI